jgi:hypothetical protein
MPLSAKSRPRLRACWVNQAPVGLVVQIDECEAAPICEPYASPDHAATK